MQDDGNLVIYTPGNLPLWSSYGGRTGYSEDTLGTGQAISAGQALWSLDGRFDAILQGDGNFVVYGPAGATWWTGTNGPGGRTLVMQTDGNLVIYGPQGAVWSWSTSVSSGDRLVMQSDGNLVIYGSAGALWSNGINNPNAVAWTQAHNGQVYGTATEQPASSHQWSGFCWTFVYDAFAGKVPRETTAQQGYMYYKSIGALHQDGSAPPAGSIAFYSFGSEGHAAIGIGNGHVVGTHGSATDRFPVYDVGYNARGLPYLGWAMP